MVPKPWILAISGKRKSGKDYCTKILADLLKKKGLVVEVAGISHSLKLEFAKIHGLDFEELLGDGPYKEQFRLEMIKWGEERRSEDSGVFCRAAVASTSSSNPEVLLISDCRRPSDIEFFKSNYRTFTIRVESRVEDREARGFKFVKGIDDADSECGLDDFKFDFVLENHREKLQLEDIITRVLLFLNIK